jgi:GntR family transcriptional regulator, galactonate operon transcriptional repressor
MAIYSGRGVHGQTVREVARRILSGTFPEGSVISVEALESELGVSRTALREALKVVAAKGLVDARQKRGTFVRPRSDWNLLDADVIRWQFEEVPDESFFDNLAEVRGIVEPAVARLAAERRTDDDVKILEEALEEMASADGEPALAVEADLKFHRALMAATHNEILVRMEVLLETGLATRDRLVHDAKPHDDPAPSHRSVFEAVRDQDAAGAEAAMSALLVKAVADVVDARKTTRSRVTKSRKRTRR